MGDPQEMREEVDHPLLEEEAEAGVVDLVEVEEDYQVVDYLEDMVVVQHLNGRRVHQSSVAKERSNPLTSSLVTEPKLTDFWMTFGSFSPEILPSSPIVM